MGDRISELILERSELHLHAMQLVETCSKRLKTISWIWGGFTIDIYQNHILREHDDIDYLTLNLHGLIPQFSELFASCGWEVNVLENGDLRLKRETVKIHLGHIEISNRVKWTHNGDKGSIWFPSSWLDTESVSFCGIEVHVVKPQFQYVMLECPQMLNPNWKHREKDILAREYLRNILGVPKALLDQVYSTEF